MPGIFVDSGWTSETSSSLFFFLGKDDMDGWILGFQQQHQKIRSSTRSWKNNLLWWVNDFFGMWERGGERRFGLPHSRDKQESLQIMWYAAISILIYIYICKYIYIHTTYSLYLVNGCIRYTYIWYIYIWYIYIYVYTHIIWPDGAPQKHFSCFWFIVPVDFPHGEIHPTAQQSVELANRFLLMMES